MTTRTRRQLAMQENNRNTKRARCASVGSVLHTDENDPSGLAVHPVDTVVAIHESPSHANGVVETQSQDSVVRVEDPTGARQAFLEVTNSAMNSRILHRLHLIEGHDNEDVAVNRRPEDDTHSATPVSQTTVNIQHATHATDIPEGIGHHDVHVPEEMPAVTTEKPMYSAPIGPLPNPYFTMQLPEFVDAELKERLETLVAFEDNRNCRYSVQTLPPSCEWGSNSDSDSFRYLCFKGKVVRIWMVGRIRTVWFFSSQGEAQERVSVGIVPFRQCDLGAALRLARNKARPSPDRANIGLATNDQGNAVYATRRMTTRVKGKSAATIEPFTHVFDATEILISKAAMVRLSAADLTTGDIVLLEATLTRWRTGDSTSSRRSWASWATGYELETISLLLSAPEDVGKTTYDDDGDDKLFL
ncbi:hypothetical protein CERSUDRAFT_78575 [Gelatoporia subvermispora B]|uniref:Uncharacterized protein n=1 Tax=Ceriporiopsis subvermispora (strain B) TaxID=914234 RepID=M2P6E3_CERS8|nr:hypothetical protein CERSUDRAFT_78575 [Gelatoporia subvermispora B]